MGEQQQIIYMQTRMVRMASEEWEMSLKNVIDLFSKYAVLGYIERCFGIFHVEGDEAIFEDVKNYLPERQLQMRLYQ